MGEHGAGRSGTCKSITMVSSKIGEERLKNKETITNQNHTFRTIPTPTHRPHRRQPSHLTNAVALL